MRYKRLAKVLALLTVLLVALVISTGNWTMPGTSGVHGAYDTPSVGIEVADSHSPGGNGNLPTDAAQGESAAERPGDPTSGGHEAATSPGGEANTPANTAQGGGATKRPGGPTSAGHGAFTPVAEQAPHYLSVLSEALFHELPPHVLLSDVHNDSFVYNGELGLQATDGMGTLAVNPVGKWETALLGQAATSDVSLFTSLEQSGSEDYLLLSHDPDRIRSRPLLSRNSTPGGSANWNEHTLPDAPLPGLGGGDEFPNAPPLYAGGGDKNPNAPPYQGTNPPDGSPGQVPLPPDGGGSGVTDDPSHQEPPPGDGLPRKVPEPETFLLLGAGLVCLALYVKFRKW